jgi:hypothetical protein
MLRLSEISYEIVMVVYHLYLLAKKNGIMISLDKLVSRNVEIENTVALISQSITNLTLGKELLYEYILVFLRVLEITEIRSNLQKSLKQLFTLIFSEYYTAVEECFSQASTHSSNIFDCSRHA